MDNRVEELSDSELTEGVRRLAGDLGSGMVVLYDKKILEVAAMVLLEAASRLDEKRQ